MNKKVLITGCSGFVGFHISKLLLENNWEVVGIDALTTYYDVAYKKKRQDILKKFKNFSVYNKNIEEENFLNDIVEKYKPNIVLHLAAQAGVRHSLENPEAYLYSNLIGTYKVLEATKNNKIDHLIMASSSYVY